ncbi:RNA polymerase sigma factor [Amycolatopsis sp. NPDC051102]|uniref:RNA polymerase sigma factor n=1 Tax=Amycolatopsis sp. NPDC051102 TaxID=3155163 RepID=UPI00341209F8
MSNLDFEAFFADDHPRLVGFLIRLGYPLAIAEESAAETMFKAHKKWAVIEHPKAWVRKVASREAMNQSIRETEDRRRSAESSWLLHETGDDSTGSVDAQLLRDQLLQSLPGDRQREIMAWTFDGFEPTEIANALGIEPESARSSLRYARAKIKKRWDQLNQHTEGGA